MRNNGVNEPEGIASQSKQAVVMRRKGKQHHLSIIIVSY